jgi:tRNA threonylcarbamoyl adenosine modification protein YeaZ
VTISLAIDTSTSRTVVGVIENGQVIFERFHDGATDHGRALSELVGQALKSSGHVHQVVVGMGPGPFTGLRVGIAFAQSFALARSIPVIGVCSLDAIAITESNYTVAIDARRKEIYWARYENGLRVAGPHVSKPSEVEGYIFEVYPDMAKLVSLATTQNVREPMYLRRPDAVPTAERP